MEYKRLFFLLMILFLSESAKTQHILSDQLRYPRVREAKQASDVNLRAIFREKGVSYPPEDIYLRAFKFDKEIELWAKSRGKATYTYIKSYEVCNTSGTLGPKREEGDGQMPEGLYNIDLLNPTSNFHLSLRVNYPNRSDRILGNKSKLGGDIYIHGDCVTIGCFPLQNGPIEELYWLTAQVKNEGGKVPMHIFPFKMDEGSMQYFTVQKLFDPKLWLFWFQLKPAYDYFGYYKKVPEYDVLGNGYYYIKNMRYR